MRWLAPALVVLALIGCSDAKKAAPSGSPNVGHWQVKHEAAPDGQMGPAVGGQQAPAAVAEKAPVRKLIYTGTVDLIVTDDFDSVRKRVVALAEQNGGYVANFNVDATSGDRRRAVYTLRVPIAKFQASMDAFGALGHLTNTHTNSQDITDEFYDLEARLKTKQEEEKSLRELLAKSTDKLENLLAIRKELARVREDIESAQGRLNKLSKLSELTTITVTMQEQKDYTPPTAPTFGTRASDTLGDSANTLWTLLKGLALAVVALVPWSPLIIIAVAILVIVVRRANRIVPPAMVSPPSPPEGGRG